MRTSMLGALGAAALIAPSLASAVPSGINNCEASTSASSPYVDNCPSGKVNFFQRYDNAANGIETGWLHRPGATDAFKTDLYSWWRNHAERGEGSEPALYANPNNPWEFPGGGFFQRALKYEKSYGIPTSTTTSTNSFLLRTRAPLPGETVTNLPAQYLNYSCASNVCSQYAGDIANQAFRTQRIQQMFNDFDAGWYKGLWIDDVPTRNMTTDGSNAGSNGIADFTPAYSPALGRVMTHTDWRFYTSKLLQEIRDYSYVYQGVTYKPFAKGTAELLVNVKWDPNVAGGGLEGTPDANQVVQGGPAQNYARTTIGLADHVDLEGMSFDTNNKGGTSTYSFANIRNYVDRIHDLGTAVVWDDFSYNEGDVEYGIAQMLLNNAGNDSVGLFNLTPANWYAGYDYDLGKAQTRVPVSTGGFVRRVFANGIVFTTDPDANGGRTTLATPASTTLDRDYVDSAGTLYKSGTTFTITTSRTAKILRVPGSTGTKPGATRADFLTISGSGTTQKYDISLTTRRGIAGKRTQTNQVAGSRGTFAADTDADGIDEITSLGNDGLVRIFKTGVGFGQTVSPTPVVTRTTALPAGPTGTFYADVTGDKKADLVSANGGSIAIDATVSTGAIAPFTSSIDPAFWGDKGTTLIDVTGDKRADLVSFSSSGTVKVAGSSVNAFKVPVTYVNSTAFIGSTANLACDISGDGRADFVTISGSTIKTSITSGDGASAGAPTTATGTFTPGESGAIYRCADFDGDGDADIVSWGATKTILTTNNYSGSAAVPFVGGKVISPADPVTGSLKLIGEFDRQ